jgi:phage/plasmid-associated DNA primase
MTFQFLQDHRVEKGEPYTHTALGKPEVGIRTVSTQEPEKGDKFNEGWTGGDRITCRPLYGEPFYFKPQFKLVFSCSHSPQLPPDDEGIWRRISVVEFKSHRFDTNDYLFSSH